MKKGILIIIILILLLYVFTFASASDISQTKRHVAMVYDDSTSMYVSDRSDKPVLNWVYANYMTQAFCALLNPQDSLYITYMSDIEKETHAPENLLKMDRSEAINIIREKTDYINQTPYKAVELAYSMLKDLKEDMQDEYWLVILTDGEFTRFEDDITEKLNGYIDEMAVIGKTLKVVFFAIGESTNPPQADETKGLFIYQTGTNEIVSTMAKVADNISGRHSVSSSRMNTMSGNRLGVDMMLPVRSLIIFNQADKNTLTEIVNSNQDKMIFSSSYDISAPDEFKYSKKITTITDKDAVGTIVRVDPAQEDAILSDGRYVLTFKKDVDIENIRVMYEPAIDITLRYKVDGKVVNSPGDGDVCDIEVVLVNALTGDPLNHNVLPIDVECNIQIISDGQVIDTSEDFIIKDVTLKSENLSVNTEITMSGYFTLRNRSDYVQEYIPKTSPTPTPFEYDKSKGPWPPEVKLLLKTPFEQKINLKELEQAQPYVFIPLFNDEPGTLKDLQMGQFDIICNREIDFDVAIDEINSGFSITPKYAAKKAKKAEKQSSI